MSESRPHEIWDLEGDALKADWGHPENQKGRHWELITTCAHLIPASSKSIIDAGCGHGHLFHALTEEQRKIYLGFDNSKKMLEIAREYFPKHQAKFVYGDLLTCSTSLAMHADAVTCVSVLIHLPELAPAIQELWKITKKTLIFTVKIGLVKHVGQYKQNRLDAGPFVLPEGKHIIKRQDVASELYAIIGSLPELGQVERIHYDPRSQIFRLTKGIPYHREVKE